MRLDIQRSQGVGGVKNDSPANATKQVEGKAFDYKVTESSPQADASVMKGCDHDEGIDVDSPSLHKRHVTFSDTVQVFEFDPDSAPSDITGLDDDLELGDADSIDGDFEFDDTDSVDLEGDPVTDDLSLDNNGHPDETGTQSSKLTRLLGGLQGAKKTIKDFAVSLPEKVRSKLPRRLVNTVALNMPSPKTLKERITGKVTEPKAELHKAKFEALKQETNSALEKIEHASVYDGDGQSIGVDQLPSLEADIAAAKTRLADLTKAYKSKGLDAEASADIQNDIDQTILNLERHQLTRKKLLDKKQLVVKSTREEKLETLNKDYQAKLQGNRTKSQNMAFEIKQQENTYHFHKSTLEARHKQTGLKGLEREVKNLEQQVDQASGLAKEPGQDVIHIGNNETINLGKLRVQLAEKKTHLTELRTNLEPLEQQMNEAKKALEKQKNELRDLDNEMIRDKREYDRGVNYLKAQLKNK